jgi:hypothetical protein
MAAIDLSHNSAPLRGGMRPSLEQVIALLRQDPLVLWDCPQATDAKLADKKFFFVKLLCLICFVGMGVAGLFLFSSGPPRVEQRRGGVAQQHVGPVPGAIVPLSSVKHSLYVVLRKPSAEFIVYLSQLASKGVTVRMVTAKSVPSGAGLTVGMVKPEQISADGVLIDGSSWYEIGADSRIE